MSTEKLILIEGGKFTEVRKTLKQWLKLHSKDFSVELTFELYRINQVKHFVRVFGNMDEERFLNLLNYFDIKVGEKYEVQVTEYTSSIHPKIELQTNPFIFKILSGTFVQVINNVAVNVVYKRFKIISFIAFGLLFNGLFIPFFDKGFFLDYAFYLSFGIGFWFILDYEMLRVNRLYLFCLFIALFFYSYCFVINDYFNFIGDFNLFSFNPLLLILAQKPLRLIFIFLFKREPSTEKPIPSIWDLIYVAILLWTLFLFTIIN